MTDAKKEDESLGEADEQDFSRRQDVIFLSLLVVVSGKLSYKAN